MANQARTITLATVRAAFARGAVKDVEQLLDQLPPDEAATPDALNLAGGVHLANKRLDDARRCYEQAVALAPEFAKAHFNLGLVALHAGDMEGAARGIGRSLELEPGNADEHLLLGNVLQALGRTDEAIAQWTLATELAPNAAAAWVNLGSHMRARGQTAAALVALERATQIEPDMAVAHLELGIARTAAGRWDDALSSLAAARRLDPDALPIALHEADALRLSGRVEAARSALIAAQSRHPESGEISKALGLIALSEGLREEAAAHYRAALARLPDDAEVRHLLSAAEGRPTETAPPEYVRNLFDAFADRFDAELRSDLRYTVPPMLATELRSAWGVAPGALRAVDLGCGTGLMGLELRPDCTHLVGVDLSPRMLEQARLRGMYHELVCADLLTYLDACGTGSFDVVTAADVFIYESRFGMVFDQCRRVLVPGGWLAFSIETHLEAGGAMSLLRPSGRFAQDGDALARLAERSGFEVVVRRVLVLRWDHGVPVGGEVVVLRRREEV
jgi:predicted TPR repeat methyltransferase